MQTFDINEAQAQLSRLVDLAANGEPFAIAKVRRKLVKVMALDAPASAQTRRLGFMAGQIEVPEDFDRMGRAEIAELFGGGG